MKKYIWSIIWAITAILCTSHTIICLLSGGVLVTLLAIVILIIMAFATLKYVEYYTKVYQRYLEQKGEEQCTTSTEQKEQQ